MERRPLAVTPFPLRVPRQPIGEPPPTCGDDYAGQLRTFVSVPGYSDGLYVCAPGASSWEVVAGTERIQDAIGGILDDTDSIALTYDDATPAITAAAVFGASSGSVAEGDHGHTPATAIRSNTTTVSASGGNGLVTASCNAGEIVTGGGCSWSGSTSDLNTRESYPDSTTSWTCKGNNDHGGDRDLTAYAICLTTPLA
jgi:hypothetical protein